MTNIETCVFCSMPDMEWRTIKSDDLMTSVVSFPWFREGHALVIPNRHIDTIDQLTDEESVAVMKELGRLSTKLDQGYGTGIMQKYQPLQLENGIKVNHLHFHVFPRSKNEIGLFPVPEPNTFDGFTKPDRDVIIAIVDDLRD